ncbi:MAG: hypothetical protein QE273_08595 [Verrucomicrobiales bacterium]|nr:hypothetical protein [Verrucomicrobiales bacterium]
MNAMPCGMGFQPMHREKTLKSGLRSFAIPRRPRQDAHATL